MHVPLVSDRFSRLQTLAGQSTADLTDDEKSKVLLFIFTSYTNEFLIEDLDLDEVNQFVKDVSIVPYENDNTG